VTVLNANLRGLAVALNAIAEEKGAAGVKNKNFKEEILEV
jgi:hypothetical protein